MVKIVLKTVKVFYRFLATFVKDVRDFIIFSFVQSLRDPGYGPGVIVFLQCANKWQSIQSWFAEKCIPLSL